MLVMNYFGKTIVLGLIVALVSLTGSFCVRPMAVQAAVVPEMASHMLPNAGEDSSVLQADTAVSHTFNHCVFDCVSQTPQAVAAKKFSVDSISGYLVNMPDDFEFSFSELSSGPTDLEGAHPPAPDILSSVVKIE